MTKTTSILSLAAGLLAFAATACSDDNDTPEVQDAPVTSADLLGEWIEAEVNDQNLTISCTTHLEDGTLEAWSAMTQVGLSIIESATGTWKFSGNELTESYPFLGSPMTNKFTVEYVDYFSIAAYHDQSGSFGVQTRVIDTYDMKPGETRKFEFGDIDFNPTAYSMLVPYAATVDGNGTITARENGIGFVMASGLEGDLVIRVNVLDPDCIINPYESLIGQPSAKAEEMFGPYCLIDAGGAVTIRYFNVYNPIIEAANVQSSLNKINKVEVALRPEIDPALVMKSLINKYGEMEKPNSLFWSKVVDINGQKVSIFYSDPVIMYSPYKEPVTPPDPGTSEYPDADFEKYDGLILMDAPSAAAALNYTLTEVNMEDLDFDADIDDNAVFRSATLFFEDAEEDYKVTTVILYTKRGVTKESLDKWYSEHYVSTGDELNPYTTPDEKYYIVIKPVGSNFKVRYSLRKNKN